MESGVGSLSNTYLIRARMGSSETVSNSSCQERSDPKITSTVLAGNTEHAVENHLSQMGKNGLPSQNLELGGGG